MDMGLGKEKAEGRGIYPRGDTGKNDKDKGEGRKGVSLAIFSQRKKKGLARKQKCRFDKRGVNLWLGQGEDSKKEPEATRRQKVTGGSRGEVGKKTNNSERFSEQIT